MCQNLGTYRPERLKILGSGWAYRNPGWAKVWTHTGPQGMLTRSHGMKPSWDWQTRRGRALCCKQGHRPAGSRLTRYQTQGQVRRECRGNTAFSWHTKEAQAKSHWPIESDSFPLLFDQTNTKNKTRRETTASHWKVEARPPSTGRKKVTWIKENQLQMYKSQWRHTSNIQHQDNLHPSKMANSTVGRPNESNWEDISKKTWMYSRKAHTNSWMK